MTRLLLLAPFLLLVACEDDVLEPPSSANAQGDSRHLVDDRVTVELTRHGVIKFDGEAVNLDQLGEALKLKAAVHHGIKKAIGKSGWEVIPGGGKATKLSLLIRADKLAPWQHIQWLLTEAAMQRYYKIYFAAIRADGKPGRVQAFLPTDKGIKPIAEIPTEVPIEVVVSVHVVARKEKPHKWRDLQVTMPTEFRYRYGDRESADLKGLAKWVSNSKKTADATPNAIFRCEIKAGHKVPFEKIVEVMSVMRAAGQRKIEFFGTQLTHGKLRKKMRLPYPKSNYGRKE